MLAIKEVHSTINVLVSSNPVPAIIFFMLRPPHLSICSLYPPRFSSFKISYLQQWREQAQHASEEERGLLHWLRRLLVKD